MQQKGGGSRRFLKAEEAEKFKTFVLRDSASQSNENVFSRGSRLLRKSFLSLYPGQKGGEETPEQMESKRRREEKKMRERETIVDKKQRLKNLNLKRVVGPIFVSGESKKMEVAGDSKTEEADL